MRRDADLIGSQRSSKVKARASLLMNKQIVPSRVQHTATAVSGIRHRCSLPCRRLPCLHTDKTRCRAGGGGICANSSAARSGSLSRSFFLLLRLGRLCTVARSLTVKQRNAELLMPFSCKFFVHRYIFALFLQFFRSSLHFAQILINFVGEKFF